MILSPLSCLGLSLGLVLITLSQLPSADCEYPGVIELVGYSNRRARTHYIPLSSNRPSEGRTLAPPPAKIQADIETVRQNIEKYNKLLTLDPKNLPESQKDMLERIVERVARLKETIEDKESLEALSLNRTQTSSEEVTMPSTASITEMSTVLEAETDPTLVLDETTLLQLQTSMDELAAAQAAVTLQTTRTREQTQPTTTEINLETTLDADANAADSTLAISADTTAQTEETGSAADVLSTTLDPLTDATDFDDQFVAARSNNVGITAADSDGDAATLTTIAGNQRTLTTSGKLSKTRATKRPSASSTKNSGLTATSTKRGQRPASAAAALHKQITTKHKLPASAAITTIQPVQYHKQSTKQQQASAGYHHKVSSAAVNPITASTPTEKRTSPQTVSTSGNTAAAYNSATVANNNNNNNNDMVYDAHVNTSAIIDSLNQAREEYYQQKVTVSQKDKKPSATAKPTKYHYYPHNQHIYLLPECAIQQVCNAVYVRLNYTQPLCACPSRYRDPCSASLNEDDQHTTKLVGDGKKKAITLAKTCEATTEMRECRSPKDWSLLALQNTRTGKSHYLVICRCPDHFKMEGPMAHDQPTYASVPGIRVFGMMCVKPGYSVRKPSIQPPKRYQLHKPFYRPGSQSSFVNNNHYSGGSSSSSSAGGTKDTYGRPSSASASNNNYHSQSIYQNQQPASYQYLNRPESSHSTLSINNYRPDTLTSINNFPSSGIYGRNNERKGDAPIEAATEAESANKGAAPISTSTQPSEARTTLEDKNSDIGNTNLAAAAPTAAPAGNDLESKRERRSADTEETYEWEDETPEFPWDRVIEFQQSVIWD